MRVTARTPRVRGHRSRRGAAAPLLAVCLVVLMGAAAYAVDTGAAWQARRRLETATDAAALAGAAALAAGGSGACSAAAATAARNDPQAQVRSCTVGTTTVAVQASRPVSFEFAPVLGRDSADVTSGTVARVSNPASVGGLRPLGLCNKAVAISQWLATGPTPVSVDLTIPYTKASPADCGASAPGNWGVLDFDGGSNSSAEVNQWLLDGYLGQVALGSSVPGNTGALSTSIEDPLRALRDSGEVFTLPLYGSVSGTGSGASFAVSGYVSVQLVGYQLTGASAQRSLTVRFLRRSVPGTGGGTQPSPGLVVSEICGHGASVSCS